MHSCDVFMSSFVRVLLQCGLYLLTFCIGGGGCNSFFSLTSNCEPESIKFLFLHVFFGFSFYTLLIPLHENSPEISMELSPTFLPCFKELYVNLYLELYFLLLVLL